MFGNLLNDLWGAAKDAGSFIHSMGKGVFGIGSVNAAENAQKENYQINLANLAQQQQNLDYQKALQQQIFAREDSSVQRQAADMEAAGLSRTLAAGGGANAGAPISTAPPQMGNIDDTSRAYNQGGMTQIASLLNQINMSTSQSKLLDEQAKAASASARLTNATAAGKEADNKSNIDEEGMSKTVSANISKVLEDTTATKELNRIRHLNATIREKYNLPEGIDISTPLGMKLFMDSAKLSDDDKKELVGLQTANRILTFLEKFFGK